MVERLGRRQRKFKAAGLLARVEVVRRQKSVKGLLQGDPWGIFSTLFLGIMLVLYWELFVWIFWDVVCFLFL